MDKFELNTQYNLGILQTYNLISSETFPSNTLPALATLIKWQSKLGDSAISLGELILGGEDRVGNLRDYFARRVENAEDKESSNKALTKQFPNLYQLDRLNKDTLRIQGLTPIEWLQLLDYTVGVFTHLSNDKETSNDWRNYCNEIALEKDASMSTLEQDPPEEAGVNTPYLNSSSIWSEDQQAQNLF